MNSQFSIFNSQFTKQQFIHPSRLPLYHSCQTLATIPEHSEIKRFYLSNQ